MIINTEDTISVSWENLAKYTDESIDDTKWCYAPTYILYIPFQEHLNENMWQEYIQRSEKQKK